MAGYLATRDLGEKLKAVQGFIPDYDTNDQKCELYADYLLNALAFAEEKGFDAPKFSAWFTIVKSTFDAARAGRVGGAAAGAGAGGQGASLICPGYGFTPRDDVYAEFKQMMVQHSVDEPPDSLHMFTIGEVQAVTDFVSMK